MDMVFKYQNKKDLEEVNKNILESFHSISTAKVLQMISTSRSSSVAL